MANSLYVCYISVILNIRFILGQNCGPYHVPRFSVLHRLLSFCAAAERTN